MAGVIRHECAHGIRTPQGARRQHGRCRLQRRTRLLPSSQPSLHGRSYPKKPGVNRLKNPQDRCQPGKFAKRSQRRNGAPHGRKSGGAVIKHCAFPGMETIEQQSPVERAGLRRVGEVDEVNTLRTIPSAHQRDLAQAEWAAAIVPYGQGIVVGAVIHDHILRYLTPRDDLTFREDTRARVTAWRPDWAVRAYVRSDVFPLPRLHRMMRV